MRRIHIYRQELFNYFMATGLTLQMAGIRHQFLHVRAYPKAITDAFHTGVRLYAGYFSMPGERFFHLFSVADVSFNCFSIYSPPGLHHNSTKDFS
ncbi:MAG: hypothetical protein LBS79_12385 [Tannerella sp.]|nr:hypothetical protein [Tannerella sp.]